MSDVNVEEIMDTLDGEELCKYCRYGIDYDCDGGIRSGGDGTPIYPPCVDGLDKEIHNNIPGGGCTHNWVQQAPRAGSIQGFNLLDSKLNKKRVLSQGCLPLWNRTHVRLHNYCIPLCA